MSRFSSSSYAHILIFGLGRYPNGSGASAMRYFSKHGADLRVTDLFSEKDLKEALEPLKNIRAEYILGHHRKQDVDWADVVIRNPGVPVNAPLLRYARKRGIPVKTDVDVFLEQVSNPVIGITGTRGKSTTSSLVHHILRVARKKPLLGGNIGNSPLNFIDQLTPKQPVVLELSSFLTENLSRATGSPHIAILTNVYKDHLDVYSSFYTYQKAKARIFEFQKANDIAIVYRDQVETRAIGRRVKSRRYWISRKPFSRDNGAFVQDGWMVIRDLGEEKRVMPVTEMSLPGEHNVMNALFAALAARMMGVSMAVIRKALTTAESLPGRLQLIRTFNGVQYVNDTQSTMPEAAVVALKSFPQKRIFWICGGNDKGVSYRILRSVMSNVSHAFLLPGTAKDKLQNVIPRSKRVDCENIHDALQKIQACVRSGDVVLLSPAATSFAQYANAKKRGDDFIRSVKRLSKQQVS